MKQTDSRQETAERTLKRAVSRFMIKELEQISQGQEPTRPVDKYIFEEWYASGLTGLELSRITDAGVQIWEKLEPHTEAQVTDLVMRTEPEIADLVDSLVNDTSEMIYQSRPDLNMLTTGYGKASNAAKGVIASTALIFALGTGFSAANLACFANDMDSMKPNAAQVERGEKCVDRTNCPPEPTPDKDCLEKKLDMHYDSTRFIDKTAKKQIEQYVLAAAKAGAKEVYVGGFASIEDSLDMAKGKAANDDSIYNMKLSKNRARKVAAIAKRFIKKHNLDKKMKVVIKSFGETEAYGKGTFPNRGYDPNRAAVLGAKPFQDPDKTPAIAPSNGRKVSCEAPITDAAAKKDGWKEYKEAKAQPQKATVYQPQYAPQPKVTVIISENPHEKKVQELETTRKQHLQTMENDAGVYRWQKKTYNRECRPETIENSLCYTPGYSQFCRGGEPKPTRLNPASACTYLDKDMRSQEEKLERNIRLMENILYKMRIAQANKSSYDSRQQPAKQTSMPVQSYAPAKKNHIIVAPNGGIIEVIENPNKTRPTAGIYTSGGLL